MGKGPVFYSEIGKKARGSRFRIISIATSSDSLWLSWVCSFLYLFLCAFSMCMSFLFFVRVACRGVGVFFLPLFACIDVSRRKKRREACVLSEVLFWSWESVKLYASQLSNILGFEFLESVNCWWWWRLLKMLNLQFFFFSLSPTRWSSDAMVSHKC
jgi:hypothetical protein